MSRTSNWKWFGLFALCFLGLLYSARHSLFKGQIIKQFYAYSITESLAKNGFRILKTTLPCPEVSQNLPNETLILSRQARWAEEPPLFHLAGAALKHLPFFHPALLPLLSFLLLAWGLVRVCATLAISPPYAFAAAFVPAFCRYSSQYLPDLFAASLLVWGAYFLIVSKEREDPNDVSYTHNTLGIFLLLLAATAKVLCIIPAFAILFARFRWRAFFSFAMLVPFTVWIFFLEQKEIPHPFRFSLTDLEGLTANRHSGPWSLLFSWDYHHRVHTWLWVKGLGAAGTLLFFFALWSHHARGTKHRTPLTLAEKILWLWALAIVPSWIFVRQGNSIHDYYVLAYLPAFAILSARALQILHNQGRRVVAGVLTALVLVSGVASSITLELTGDAVSPEIFPGSRPILCLPNR